jgi:hypothetical protein
VSTDLAAADDRLLEIGALLPDNYASCSSWIKNHPIDLQSTQEGVLQQDFFDRPLPAIPEDAFDVISCSLVLNFVSEPKDRGESNVVLKLIKQAGC